MFVIRALARVLGMIDEGNGSVSLADFLRLSPALPPPATPPTLSEEELLPGASPDKGILVFVHGNYWKDSLGRLVNPSERTFLFRPLREDPRFQELRRRYRVMFFNYPTQDDCQIAGQTLADLLTAKVPPTPGVRDVTIVAHSLGGLVARYAMQDGLGERVDTLHTLATPHRGTMLVSILLAPPKVRSRIGLFGLFCQRLCRRVWPVNAGIATMASDDWDGRIGQKGHEDYGLHINRKLAELNRTDKYLDRVVALMGRVRGKWLSGRNVFDQVPRWVMGRMDPIYQGLDPLVHFESGTGEGLAFRARHVLDDLDHEGIVTDIRSRDYLYGSLLGTEVRLPASRQEPEPIRISVRRLSPASKF